MGQKEHGSTVQMSLCERKGTQDERQETRNEVGAQDEDKFQKKKQKEEQE